VLSLALSTVAFFVASYLIKRYLDGIDVPKGATRSIVIFSLALGASYLVAALTDWLAG
jgi:hypothetical protein